MRRVLHWKRGLIVAGALMIEPTESESKEECDLFIDAMRSIAEEAATNPDLVKTVPHVAFEVDDLTVALEGRHVIIEPNSPSRGVLVAFIEVSGAPVELMQIDHEARPDL